jgi:group I intron endonuclease
MEYVIYSITCKETGKKYFGRSQEVEKRWRAHKNMLRRSIHNNPLLQSDWNDYGEDNFTFEILHTYSDINEAVLKEQEYIDDNSYDKYNISDAKDGGDTFTNNPRSEEIRKLKSINSSGKNNPMYGKPKNDYTIKRIKEANSKKVIINNMVYDSLTQASKELGLGTTTISYRLNAKSFTDWKYA